jgi:hypothetical protein
LDEQGVEGTEAEAIDNYAAELFFVSHSSMRSEMRDELPR